jgi:REP element-mobilizing transposase RayT
MDHARIWHLTWTTYATWLPGDPRGSVTSVRDASGPRQRHNNFGEPYDAEMPGIHAAATAAIKGGLVVLTAEQALVIERQFKETAGYRGWRILALAVMATHLHLLVSAGDNVEPDTLLRDFKSYASRALNRNWRRPASGTWWTESGSRRRKDDESAVLAAIRYIARQESPLVVSIADEWTWCLKSE